MDDVTATRLALNEARFRELNERLASDVAPLLAPAEAVAFVCECSSAACRDTVALTLDQYAVVRADDLLFAVVPGHQVPEVESVERREDTFVVVRKRRGQDVVRRSR
ncbi:MAG TPA: hypothetical protein VF533_15470 [Solirubrobacteraceae bacterium]